MQNDGGEAGVSTGGRVGGEKKTDTPFCLSQVEYQRICRRLVNPVNKAAGYPFF